MAAAEVEAEVNAPVLAEVEAEVNAPVLAEVEAEDLHSLGDVIPEVAEMPNERYSGS
jgi:hypothetical protein